VSRGLRRKLTSYGDQEFSLYLRKAFIKAMGFSDDDLERPIVGIANTYSDYNPCHGNVPQLIEATKRGAMLAGALPMVFPTISIHESFAAPTSMYLRNLMAISFSLPGPWRLAITKASHSEPAPTAAVTGAASGPARSTKPR
jgi:dihydroxy-acid dehydratase